MGTGIDEISDAFKRAVTADLRYLKENCPPDRLSSVATTKVKLTLLLIEAGYHQTAEGTSRRLSGNGLPRRADDRREFFDLVQRVLSEQFETAGLELDRDYTLFVDGDAAFVAGPSRAKRKQGPGLIDFGEDLIQASYERDRIEHRLPRLQLPCEVFTPHKRSSAADAERAVLPLLVEPDTNLLVVLGEFGAGKSELLRRLATAAWEAGQVPLLLSYAELGDNLRVQDAQDALMRFVRRLSKPAARELEHRLVTDPASVFVLVDAVDEASFAREGHGGGPDLADLADLLRGGVNVAVATRQSLTANTADLLQRLERPVEAESIGVRSHLIVELHPCTLEGVMAALEHLESAQAEIMRDYLRSSPHIQMDRVRRPLVLQMLIDLPASSFSDQEPFSVYRLYDLYIDGVLDREMHAAGSSISVNDKRKFLRYAARDMFASQARRSTTDLTLADLRAAADLVRNGGDLGFTTDEHPDVGAWLRDVLHSTPLIAATNAAAEAATLHRFVHHSIFEFFLTQHLVAQYHETGQFGLRDDDTSLAAFDSLLPYFLRSKFSGDDQNLVRLAMNEDTSNLDRMLAFFFLEDHPEIEEMMDRAARDFGYESFLHRAERDVDSYFMTKLVRFQLVLRDSGLGRALAYVYDARLKEKDQELDIEVHTFAAGQRPSEFLVARTHNPCLWTAMPILVYRLGLFGEMSAIPRLEELAAARGGPLRDPMFQVLVAEAMTRIRERSEGTPQNRQKRLSRRSG